MEGLRWIASESARNQPPCSRCQSYGCPWDHIAGQPICPDCQELLVRGEGAPLVERVDRRPCVVCQQVGTIRFMTMPLRGAEALEIDLCGPHFQALLRRRLDRYAYRQLGQALQRLGVSPREVFLLHEAFYDDLGHPLQPVSEPF